MNDTRRSSGFWIGNILLAIALGMLIFMGPLSQMLGIWAMALWMVLAGAGFHFVTRDRRDPSLPD
jgi:hypothetical protein